MQVRVRGFERIRPRQQVEILVMFKLSGRALGTLWTRDSTLSMKQLNQINNV